MADNNSFVTSGPGKQAIKKAKQVVAYAKIYDKKKIYFGPRKDDAEPSATFTYGDGSYIVKFHYVKNNKASLRGSAKSETSQHDNKGEKKKVDVEPKVDPGSTTDPNANTEVNP